MSGKLPNNHRRKDAVGDTAGLINALSSVGAASASCVDHLAAAAYMEYTYQGVVGMRKDLEFAIERIDEWLEKRPRQRGTVDLEANEA